MLQNWLYLFSLFLGLSIGFLRPSLASTIERISFSQIRPTQAVAGFAEIEHKAKKIAKISRDQKELDDYILSRPAPAVLAPNGFYYILDRHHELLAMMEAGVQRPAVELVADYSKLSMEDFKKEMLAHNWLYLRDENGRAVLHFEDLPQSLTELRDDPYRALAWFLKREDGYEKSRVPFSDFEWANALRYIVPRKTIVNDFDKALKMAKEFAESKEANYLPGARWFKRPPRRCLNIWLPSVFR